VHNSFEFFNTLSGKDLNNSVILVFLDAISLFTNIFFYLVITGIKKRWNFIQQCTNIPEKEFISIIKFILLSTFFTFNDIIYKQIFGTPMGSPLSPIIADIVMQDLDEESLKNISTTDILLLLSKT